MSLMDFHSPRLQHQPLRAAHWPVFYALHQHPEVMRYVADIGDIDEVQERFQQRLNPTSMQPCWYTWAIAKRSGELIGVTGFYRHSEHLAELGFMLLPQYQGQGLGSESLHALLEHGHSQFSLREYTATVTAGNEASRALLLKQGFTQHCQGYNGYYINGEEVEDWLFKRTFSDGE
ncbi:MULTISPECIES: GNAT family N-acetyltransferase [Pseudoalteromonas]|uniref:N-acetyltransferase domain-containing protein n=1 Tax=Pseudoalteromonas ruthenica TaxID=151081 RepID=A0A0F4PTU0_9GAMM|nr:MULTISPECIES: GNAT family N-acetyltransferase [Pseudoalteromonas]KJY98905.1 hypothetical protein TW76_04210 [Pseudoalteromonas ruthenica]KJZ01438.1 hypothetical protein TW72_03980 [Pseudoalteromonas ruthenica]MCG7568991.1 GNAT family N-acetyltransferase [Pseudoalteromonas sp. CNC9-20]TMO89867.1 GNAT family N-acetyltransferase [Pseudoalteromonas ruthenica]TMO91622.1 GNAT family N-acetyltransferase [Pseudoalteromonas ruthenica]|tara:strand:+ start:23422 stop:23949 length:528 start_codon:yes stop_codon:yes gene_type:complete